MALGQRLEGNGHIGRRAAARRPKTAGTDRSRDRAHGRVVLDHGGHFVELALHELERVGRVAPNAALYLAGILLWKEALGNNDVEKHVQGHGREQGRDHYAAVIERPLKCAHVFLSQTLEPSLECASKSRRLARALDPEKLRAHHRRRGERDYERNEDRDGQRDGELTEDEPHDAA
jgi:hypothetical protein